MKLRTKKLKALILIALAALLTASPAIASEPVVLVDFSWDSVQMHNRIAGYVIEHGFGKKVDYLFAESMPGFMGLERGDAHLTMEGWVDNLLEVWERVTASGKVESLGTNYPDAPQGWYVPTYMIEGDKERGIEPVAPALKSVADLPKYKDLFTDPENPNMGRLYNGPAGWNVTSINEMKVKAYALADDYEAFSAGSETALSTAIRRAYDRGEPVLAYYWEPTWIMGLMKMTKLEEPAHDENLWNEDNNYGCAFPSVRVLVVANSEFIKENPEIAEFLRNYSTTLEQNNRALAFMFENDAATEDAAIWFLREYKNVWTEWLTEETAEKVLLALKEEK